MDVHNSIHTSNPPTWLKSWNGYSSDSFFSGVVIKYPHIDNEPDYGLDYEKIIVGWYCS